MMESGYDDIDFVSSITEEELMEIGIAKKGFTHMRTHACTYTHAHTHLHVYLFLILVFSFVLRYM